MAKTHSRQTVGDQILMWSLRRSIALTTKQWNFSRSMTSAVVEKTSGVVELIQPNEINNISETIASKVGTNLHLIPNHPLNIIKKKIEAYFVEIHEKQGYLTS